MLRSMKARGATKAREFEAKGRTLCRTQYISSSKRLDTGKLSLGFVNEAGKASKHESLNVFTSERGWSRKYEKPIEFEGQAIK
jgi:hypothetical protein